MKKYRNHWKIFILILFCSIKNSMATFSIVGVDLGNNYVGGAGASCISGSIVINALVPGVGALHSQALHLNANRDYAQRLMERKMRPQHIIDSVTRYDAGRNATLRQYGVVTLANNGESAGYTGSRTTPYTNHQTGKTFSLQGNILLGKQILDSMNVRYNREQGTLADKLMAALQGAKVVGADTRCRSSNRSTISAFIRVAKPTDRGSNIFLHLNVNNTSPGQEPIDILQQRYNEWKRTLALMDEPSPKPLLRSDVNSGLTKFHFQLIAPSQVAIHIYSLNGKEILSIAKKEYSSGSHTLILDPANQRMQKGLYFYRSQIGSEEIRGTFAVLD